MDKENNINMEEECANSAGLNMILPVLVIPAANTSRLNADGSIILIDIGTNQVDESK